MILYIYQIFRDQSFMILGTRGGCSWGGYEHFSKDNWGYEYSDNFRALWYDILYLFLNEA